MIILRETIMAMPRLYRLYSPKFVVFLKGNWNAKIGIKKHNKAKNDIKSF